jgi:hypothetical protein
MNLTLFLSGPDAQRAGRTLTRLRRHSIEEIVLTGGLAIELHLANAARAQHRPFNDIDFLAATFDAIPTALSQDLIFRHVHPDADPGKTLLQAVDPQTAVRVDIFRACGNTLARALPVQIAGATLRIASIEDVAARAARLSMDLASSIAIPAKHARDLLRLLPLIDSAAVEPAWRDHRKSAHPETFAEAARLLAHIIPARPNLLIEPAYSRDPNQPCSRCQATPAFPLAEGARILALLGYC